MLDIKASDALALTATEERFALATDYELDIVPPTEEKFTLAYPITSFGPH
jgi:hypothetical protein